MAFSLYTRNNLLNYLHRNVAAPSLATPYLGLFTAFTAPSGTTEATFTEVGVGSYARQALSGVFGSSSPTNGSMANVSAIQFPVSTEVNGYGTNPVIYVGIFDASSGGNLIQYGQLASSRQINQNDQFQMLIGELTDTLT